MKQLARYTVVGFELAGSIGVGFFGGRFLDRRLGTHGWLTWIGLAAGVFAGFHSLWVTARNAQRALDAEDAKNEKTAEAAAAAGRTGKRTPDSDRSEDDDGRDRPN